MSAIRASVPSPAEELDLPIAFGEHILTLLSFHHDDDRDQQFADPVKSWRAAENGQDRTTLIVTLESGLEVVMRFEDARYPVLRGA